MWWKCESQIHHKILAKHILRHCDKNVMIMWLGKKIYESHLHHNFITILKVMKMWRKCDELTLVLIFWLLSFENSRHGKKVDDHQRWRREMIVCSALITNNKKEDFWFCKGVWILNHVFSSQKIQPYNLQYKIPCTYKNFLKFS